MLDRLQQRIRNNMRAWVLGESVVSPWEMGFGHYSEFTPTEYGNYLSASNGVYTCITLRANLLSSLPPMVYRMDKDGQAMEQPQSKALALLHDVNPWWTFSRLIEMTEQALCLWGSAYWFLDRGESGRLPPQQIWWGRPDRVRVVPSKENYISRFLYQPDNNLDVQSFEPSEVIWFRFPNAVDEFSGLSPLVAARLSADFASAAMQSNERLFRQGLQMGGGIYPANGQNWTEEQAHAVERKLEQRFKGVDKAHRWGVFRQDIEVKSFDSFSPSDAEFLGGLNWALEDIARAYHVPLDLIGGQRTYQNVEGAMKAVWTNCIIPEASFIADELTEQFLPMFPAEKTNKFHFDASGISVLQEDRSEIIEQMKTLFDMGVPLNVLLDEFQPNLKRNNAGYAWGDVWWAPFSLMPVQSAEVPMPKQQPEQLALPEPPKARMVAFGGQQHQAIWQRFARRTESQERKLGQIVADLLRRQQDSVLAMLKQRGQRSPEGAMISPFDMAKWVKLFRGTVRPVLNEFVQDAGTAAFTDLGLSIAFDVSNPLVVRFLENRVQRFAERVNETTWNQLQGALSEGIQAGEGIPALEARVEAIMGNRIRSSAETIARTEVVGANNGGTLLAWEQTELPMKKSWLAALDGRQRTSHEVAHNEYQNNPIPLDADFIVGSGSGPAPGQIGVAEEDINCRCTIIAELE